VIVFKNKGGRLVCPKCDIALFEGENKLYQRMKFLKQSWCGRYKNINVLLFFFLFISIHSNGSSDLYLLDTIEAVVRIQKDTEIITKSDVDRPSLGGEMRSLQDIVFERSLFLDAKRQGIPCDEDALEAYLMAIQHEHNLTRDGLKSIFTAAGYTYEEGREQLQMMQTSNTMIDFKIRSNLIVPRKDVVAYYQAHPQVVEPSYVLQRAVIPLSSTKTKEEQKRELAIFSKNKKGVHNIIWSELFSIDQSDIAQEKQFIITMEPGDISLPIEISDGFELFRLVEKTEERVLTLDERYREIADILRQPKYEELLQAYKDSLFDTASITYFTSYDEI